MSHVIAIDASPKQLSRLRNGHKVRVKSGTGFNVIVHPTTYNMVQRAFARSSGTEIKLSPEELELNRSISPEAHAQYKKQNPTMAGEGIFGKKFDRFLKKLGVKKQAYAIGEQLKPLVKAGLTTGLSAGATALGAIQPELIPFLPAGVAGLSAMGYDYLDNPDKYQGKSGIKMKGVKNFAEQAVKARVNEQLNKQLGTNYDYMSRAGVESALMNEASSQLNKASIVPREVQPPAPTESMNDLYLRQLSGHGLGTGLYAGRSRGGRIGHNNDIGGRAMPIHEVMPQALQSQPLGTNFQMQHFLPPAYHKYNTGSGLGCGLGAGMKGGRIVQQKNSHVKGPGANFQMQFFLPAEYQRFSAGAGLYA